MGASDVCTHWHFWLGTPSAPSLGSVRQEESPPPCQSSGSLASLPSLHCSVVLGLFYIQYPIYSIFLKAEVQGVFSCLPLPHYLFADWDLPSLYFINDFFHFYLGTIPASSELLSKELESVSESVATPTRTVCGHHRGLVSP